MPDVDILVPTINRRESLIFTLAGVASQSVTSVRLIVADQSDEKNDENPVVQALVRVIGARGGEVEWHNREPIHGIAEQRQFLLRRSTAAAILYLDDDVFMEPWVLCRLLEVLGEQRCGFVGAFPTALSYRDDRRPAQQVIEFWDGPVQPEAILPDGPGWDRAQLHRAANLYHVAERLAPGDERLYKVAWIASCVLYDREKVEAVGGFSFWPRLPRWHSGEEVLVQNLLQRRWGGCSVIPSGTYFSEVPTTVLNDRGTVDGHALDLLPDYLSRESP